MPSTPLPGLNKINSIIQAYSSAWDQNVAALNEAWTTLTSEGVTLDKLPGAWSKVIQSWAEGAQDICDAYIGASKFGTHADAPVITLTVKSGGTTAADPALIPLPPGVSASAIQKTSLQQLGTTGTPPAPTFNSLLDDSGGKLIVNVTFADPAAPSTWLGFLYVEGSAGSPPPPKPFATVLVVIV